MELHILVLNCNYKIFMRLIVLEKNKDIFHVENFKIKVIYYFFKKNEKNEYNHFNIIFLGLLYHGSRTLNYVGILSEGLRIAPPDAPVSGYMFGKGIYFTDVPSKSA